MSPGGQMGVALLAFGALSLTMLFLSLGRAQRNGGFGRVPPPDHPPARKNRDYPLELPCGARINGLGVSRPTATLLVDTNQAELRAWATDPIRITRDEVTGLRWIAGGWTGPGLKFRTESGRLDKVTVWPGPKARQKLHELGWK